MKKTLLKAGVIGLLVSGWISSNLVLGQSDPSGKKRITDTYAITNATVFTAPGKAGTKATVLIQDGIILGVGTNLSLPKEAKLIAGDSLFIYPGFIDGASDAGITKPKDLERSEGFVSSNPGDEIAGITPWRSAKDQFSITGDKVDDLRKNRFYFDPFCSRRRNDSRKIHSTCIGLPYFYQPSEGKCCFGGKFPWIKRHVSRNPRWSNG